jgi:pyruvate,orthophosphate dikinase
MSSSSKQSSSNTNKWAWYFGEGPKDKYIVGGKGLGLSDMSKIGLPVPPGFTISTQSCTYYSKNKSHPPGMDQEVSSLLNRLQQDTQKTFGSTNPGKNGLLLLSVRSGSAISMPGMMDTILNLGLNDSSVELLAKLTNNPRFAYDSYRRFINMFGDVVLSVPGSDFEHALTAMKQRKGVKYDTELTSNDLRDLCQEYKQIVLKHTKKPFPMDPQVQINSAIDAVFRSWDADRAVYYRTMNGIPHTMGTAVNVQSMVFGNMSDDSGTGVAFTRSPTTGEKAFYGEYLTNAQGEDVVAGIRTPEPIAQMEKRWPKIYAELSKAFHTLESFYKEMQDVEFTIERGKLYMLQTRKGKRTAHAAIKIAVDMHSEGVMTQDEALLAVDPAQIDQLLHKQIDPNAKKSAKLLGKGLPASPGAAVGQVVFSPDEAVAVKKSSGQPVVLVRQETSPEDIQGMEVAAGVLTQRGGMTSHAAVVARGMGRCCVSGCEALIFDSHHATQFILSGVTIKRGDWITLDGSTGEIFQGKVGVRDPILSDDYYKLMRWADATRTLKVRTNADTPQDAKKAIEFGAEGIGLVRTEHMFFAEDRINIMRTMILANDDKERAQSLERLLPFQRSDFEGIFTAMSGKPVIIRLLDPPFHEFLPHEDNEIAAVAKLVPGATPQSVKTKIAALAEANPMLGFRGCRLGLIFPQITEMQLKAIFQAAMNVKKRGIVAIPEIEVPLVGNLKEFLPFKEMARKVAKETGAEQAGIHYAVGSMIEVPRAALVADELAAECDFLSFGTNDLTQMTCGFSRDDAAKFLTDYVRQGIYDVDPFVTIDQEGVGKMMKLTVALARGVKPGIDIGICGEHGGNFLSIEFCHRIGLSNVSCSPFRVPIARLAAAQARIKYGPQPTKLSLTDIFPTLNAAGGGGGKKNSKL